MDALWFVAVLYNTVLRLLFMSVCNPNGCWLEARECSGEIPRNGEKEMKNANIDKRKSKLIFDCLIDQASQ